MVPVPMVSYPYPWYLYPWSRTGTHAVVVGMGTGMDSHVNNENAHAKDDLKSGTMLSYLSIVNHALPLGFTGDTCFSEESTERVPNSGVSG